VTDLVLSQLGDLFRIGLIVALVVTMRRTAAVTGRVVPLALGVVFVAVMQITCVICCFVHDDVYGCATPCWFVKCLVVAISTVK
jgi:hypothetical protein